MMRIRLFGVAAALSVACGSAPNAVLCEQDAHCPTGSVCSSGVCQAPDDIVAQPNADLFVTRATNVTFDGSASTAHSGRPLTFTWTQVSGPDVTGGTQKLTGVRPAFTAPDQVATLIFELTVTDGIATSKPARLQINVMEDASKAIFVAKTGTDTAAGTRDAPMLTIQAAINKAAATASAVYVQAGDYPESLTLASGVSVYGGFDTSWVRDPRKATTKVIGGTQAITGRTMTSLTVDGFFVTSANATEPGASSYAFFFANSTNVTLSNNDVTAGNGSDGSPGLRGENGADPGPAANGAIGPAGFDCPFQFGVCGVAFSGNGGTIPGGFSGGTGGLGLFNDAGNNGFPGDGGLANQGTGAVRGVVTGGVGGPGFPGAPGGPGNDGAAFGTPTKDGYLPADGSTGVAGGFGGGGGGGGAGGGFVHVVMGGIDTTNGGTGGGGGAGGAPGAGGGGGKGGGGSFGIYLFDSTVLQSRNTIRVGVGGLGGQGGEGGIGAFGGSGGEGAQGFADAAGVYSGPGGRGGNGGPGGQGGKGGNGGMGPARPVFSNL